MFVIINQDHYIIFATLNVLEQYYTNLCDFILSTNVTFPNIRRWKGKLSRL
jgi:hypothetical protein